jgi:ribokinase
LAQGRVVVMGSFVADVAFRVDRLPGWGETRMGSAFALGPGGKGSNQAVAAARAGGQVSFISKLGGDAFGDMARKLYRDDGIDARHVYHSDVATGAAAILIDEARGENGIIVVPGACFTLTPAEIDGAREVIAEAHVFVTQLELSLAAVEHGIRLAHSLHVTTVLNPAPACDLPAILFPLCDYITPNESEAEALTGVRVVSIADAERAADALLARGVRHAVITLGAQGVLVRNAELSVHIPAFSAGPVVETTGAGDAFTGGFAVALAEGRSPIEAARFGCAVAGIAVTRAGTAPSLPQRHEIEALLERSG